MPMKTIAVIPARLGSTRLARKVLADIHGKPLIWHVWNRVKQAKHLDQIYIATDSPEVEHVALAWGAQVLMTSPDCQSGTERIASVLDQIEGDLILNVQGDEPLVSHTMLDDLVKRWKSSPCDLITPVFPIHDAQEIQNPNIVKVARAYDGRALYFSRNAVPYVRDEAPQNWLNISQFWGHIGVYGYRRDVLAKYKELPVSPLEQSERLEQLRFLEAGYIFQTIETDYRPLAVDVADDLEKVRALLAQDHA